EIDLARACWAIIPSAIFWGASFPLALAAVAGKTAGDPAKAVGKVYAANTLGAIVGALFFSLMSIQYWGTQGSQYLLVGLAGFAAVIAAFSGALPEKLDALGQHSRQFVTSAVTLVLALAVLGGTLFAMSAYRLAQVPWRLVAYGRQMTGMDWKSPDNIG